MLRRLSSVLAGISAIAATLLVIGSAAPAGASPSQPSAVGLLALRNGDIAAGDASRYGVVVMNAWESGRIPALKAANPGLEVLVYKDMSSTRSYAVRNGVDDAKLPTGVGYAFAERANPGWFLSDSNGQRVEWSGYAGHWWMNVGDASYQDAWLAGVQAELSAGGWDGVMVDNTMDSMQYYLPSGRSIPQYPNDTAYSAATESFLAKVGPALKSSGFAVVPNLGGNFVDTAKYRRWVTYSSGALREHYGRWGSDGNGLILTDWAWSHQLEQQEIVQSTGGAYIAVPYGKTSDVAFQRYVRSSFLMGWDGRSGGLLYTPPSAGVDPWSSEWTADVGVPTAARQAVGAAWKRTYSAGVVVVNPSGSTTVTVPLGGTFVGPDGALVSSVTLAPASGLVLGTVGGATTVPFTAPSPIVTASPAAPAPAASAASPASAGPVVTGGSPTPDGRGYWVLGADGGVFSYGRAAFYGSLPGLGIRNRAVTLAATPSGNGYWLLGGDGGIFAFGDAGFFGSVPGLGLSSVTALDLQPTPSGNGYWILGADGGIFTFGDAGFFGSVPGLGIRNGRAVKIVPTPSGNGYWILGADGGVFSFGDAAFFGSLPGLGVRNTSIAMTPTPSGKGYWVLGADGGIFTFGDAAFFGSVPGLGQKVPGVQMRATKTGGGYYVLSERGDVFAFGDAPGMGSPANLGIRGQDLAVTA
jgi:hypothetical protein